MIQKNNYFYLLGNNVILNRVSGKNVLKIVKYFYKTVKMWYYFKIYYNVIFNCKNIMMLMSL